MRRIFTNTAIMLAAARNALVPLLDALDAAERAGEAVLNEIPAVTANARRAALEQAADWLDEQIDWNAGQPSRYMDAIEDMARMLRERAKAVR